MSDLSRLRRTRHVLHRRALARIPERPSAIARVQPLLDRARDAGIVVEELDAQHVRLRYDSRLRDQWLIVDEVFEAVRDHATVAGDGQTDAAPDNWMIVHFDFGSCGQSFAP
jgi:hypothetical protein